MRITGNAGGAEAQRRLGQVNERTGRSLERLGSGRRVGRASDDAAGLGRAQRLRAQIDSLEVAGRDADQGVSLARTAEAGLGEVQDNLGRMRELAVQAGDGPLSDADRQALQAEFDELAGQVDQVATSTEFNGQALLDGSVESVEVQTGDGSGDVSEVELTSATTADLGLDAVDLSTPEGAADAIAAIDVASETVSTAQGELGAKQSSLASTSRSIGVRREGLARTESALADADAAMEAAELAKLQILQQSSLARLAQGGLSGERASQLLAG